MSTDDVERMQQLRDMYATKLAERTERSGSLFKVTEVKREVKPFWIQCCIR